MAQNPVGYARVGLWELVILLYNVWKASQDPEIEHADPRYGPFEFLAKFKKTVYLKTKDVESLLWSANMLDEKGEFWHPTGRTFDTWVRLAFPQFNYDRQWSLFEVKKKYVVAGK